jgi:hypothetical protein
MCVSFAASPGCLLASDCALYNFTLFLYQTLSALYFFILKYFMPRLAPLHGFLCFFFFC